MGRQPSQQMLPQHTGLKALYWRTQKLQPQEQQPPQVNRPNAPAKEGAATSPQVATASTPARRSFFMGVSGSPVEEVLATILVAGSRPLIRGTLPGKSKACGRAGPPSSGRPPPAPGR